MDVGLAVEPEGLVLALERVAEGDEIAEALMHRVLDGDAVAEDCTNEFFAAGLVDEQEPEPVVDGGIENDAIELAVAVEIPRTEEAEPVRVRSGARRLDVGELGELGVLGYRVF